MKSKLAVPSEKVRVSKEIALILWSQISEVKLPFGAEYLRYKLGWSEQFGIGAISEYRKFSFMAYISKSEITPSECIDEVWHYHILHTRAYQEYAKMCGSFLHHNPGSGKPDPRFMAQYEFTFELYRLVFGEDPPALFWRGHGGKASSFEVMGRAMTTLVREKLAA